MMTRSIVSVAKSCSVITQPFLSRSPAALHLERSNNTEPRPEGYSSAPQRQTNPATPGALPRIPRRVCPEVNRICSRTTTVSVPCPVAITSHSGLGSDLKSTGSRRDTSPARNCRFVPGEGNTGTPLHVRSEEHTSELQSLRHLVCRLLLEKKT